MVSFCALSFAFFVVVVALKDKEDFLAKISTSELRQARRFFFFLFTCLNLTGKLFPHSCTQSPRVCVQAYLRFYQNHLERLNYVSEVDDALRGWGWGGWLRFHLIRCNCKKSQTEPNRSLSNLVPLLFSNHFNQWPRPICFTEHGY